MTIEGTPNESKEVEVNRNARMNNFFQMFLPDARIALVNFCGKEKLSKRYISEGNDPNEYNNSQKRLDQTIDEFFETIDEVTSSLGIDVERVKALASQREEAQGRFVVGHNIRVLSERELDLLQKDFYEKDNEFEVMAKPIYEKLLEMGYNLTDIDQ